MIPSMNDQASQKKYHEMIDNLVDRTNLSMFKGLVDFGEEPYEYDDAKKFNLPDEEVKGKKN